MNPNLDPQTMALIQQLMGGMGGSSATMGQGQPMQGNQGMPGAPMSPMSAGLNTPKSPFEQFMQQHGQQLPNQQQQPNMSPFGPPQPQMMGQ